MSIPKRSNLGPPTKPIAPADTPAAPSVADSFIEPTYTMLTVRIEENVHRRFKTAAAAHGEKMRDIIEQLLEDWTRQHTV